MLVLWWLKWVTSSHKPFLLARGIVPSPNLGSSKLLATIESDKMVVRNGVVGDTECNSICAVITHCDYLETFNLSSVLSTHAFSWLHAIIHNIWKLFSFYSTFFLCSQIGWEHGFNCGHYSFQVCKRVLMVIMYKEYTQLKEVYSVKGGGGGGLNFFFSIFGGLLFLVFFFF